VAGGIWGLGSEPVDREAAFDFDIDALRAAALASGEPLPVAMEQFIVARGSFPRAVVVAGSGLFASQEMVFRTHILGYEDGRTVLVDPVHSRAVHEKNFGGQFNEKTWNFMQDAMQDASLVLATHEHLDHINGIAAAPAFAQLAPKVMLTREQFDNQRFIRDAGFTAEQLEALTPLEYDGVYSPMPGIAVKKTPGHSLGHQVIYVQLANGEEYLFVGDIAWAWDNIREQRGRARLVSALFLDEDQQQVAAQLAGLKALAEEGRINLVVSHDLP
jgi:glyoxylase-like metal-dependent hydrolase (beta-lactamase superfamily II)